ncbi:MAG: hypothetical protein DRP42_03540 [Tenericutes bacterium]|nr:MAG: hypothetical protein DRP42_03540 [Mycoplasmatota bacterium]
MTLTDHDSVQHYHAAAAANKKYPKMKINYGLEISVVDDTDI